MSKPKRLIEEEIKHLRATLRGFLNDALQRHPKVGHGDFRRLRAEVLVERFGRSPKWLRTPCECQPIAQRNV